MRYTLKQKAYEFLYKAILSNVYQPGSPLVEKEISEKIGVSRTPVREAFKQLESEGLIKYYPSRGAFVAEMTTQDVDEILQLRESLEILALRLSINRISNEEIEAVGGMLEKLEDEHSHDSYYECDRALHNMMFINSGNRRLMEFMNMINAQIERLRSIAAKKPRRLAESKKEHILILNSIRKRDLEVAEKYLAVHIRNVAEAIKEVCRSQGYLMKKNDFRIY